jgi:hypothetical protein
LKQRFNYPKEVLIPKVFLGCSDPVGEALLLKIGG